MEINKSALAWFAIFVRSSSGTNVSSERVYTTSAPGSRCSMIFPSRSATSKHRSFSIKPVGPIVPVSGPPGLMEKDLCLDVALRLGKIIEQRLPGADVVYTRSDDTFVPLEERTNIANQAKADLFISIHANSSRDHGARGIETYYLNLKGSPDAMEVASRENATAQGGVHDLQDLVLKITRTEKIDESKELAEDIQDSLAKRIQKTSKPVKNRE